MNAKRATLKLGRAHRSETRDVSGRISKNPAVGEWPARRAAQLAAAGAAPVLRSFCTCERTSRCPGRDAAVTDTPAPALLPPPPRLGPAPLRPAASVRCRRSRQPGADPGVAAGGPARGGAERAQRPAGAGP